MEVLGDGEHRPHSDSGFWIGLVAISMTINFAGPMAVTTAREQCMRREETDRQSQEDLDGDCEKVAEACDDLLTFGITTKKFTSVPRYYAAGGASIDCRVKTDGEGSVE